MNRFYWVKLNRPRHEHDGEQGSAIQVICISLFLYKSNAITLSIIGYKNWSFGERMPPRNMRFIIGTVFSHVRAELACVHLSTFNMTNNMPSEVLNVTGQVGTKLALKYGSTFVMETRMTIKNISTKSLERAMRTHKSLLSASIVLMTSQASFILVALPTPLTRKITRNS